MADEVDKLDEMLASVLGMINLMRAALPRRSGGSNTEPVIHQIAAEYEPACRAVREALARSEPALASLKTEFTSHYMAPATNRVIRCFWAGYGLQAAGSGEELEADG